MVTLYELLNEITDFNPSGRFPINLTNLKMKDFEKLGLYTFADEKTKEIEVLDYFLSTSKRKMHPLIYFTIKDHKDHPLYIRIKYTNEEGKRFNEEINITNYMDYVEEKVAVYKLENYKDTEGIGFYNRNHINFMTKMDKKHFDKVMELMLNIPQDSYTRRSKTKKIVFSSIYITEAFEESTEYFKQPKVFIQIIENKDKYDIKIIDIGSKVFVNISKKDFLKDTIFENLYTRPSEELLDKIRMDSMLEDL